MLDTKNRSSIICPYCKSKQSSDRIGMDYLKLKCTKCTNTFNLEIKRTIEYTTHQEEEDERVRKWIILYHGMKDWDEFEGTLPEAIEVATLNDQHVDYSRTGVSIINQGRIAAHFNHKI